MPKDGVDWKAEQEYLESIGFSEKGPTKKRDLTELMESFNGPVDELGRRVQETLTAAGYEGTVHLSLQVGVGNRALTQTLHTTWGKDHESSTRTLEETDFSSIFPAPQSILLTAMTLGGMVGIMLGAVLGQTWLAGTGLGALTAVVAIVLISRSKAKE